ncbi:nitrilase [Halioglobus maricola]|uniref:Nitrilase n=2 Tax=Halioglobus maricola TaxID=2601894 RepID=A0A5P9NQ79_9GAMM|nr:nitrilase [Halioglobus maricola]
MLSVDDARASMFETIARIDGLIAGSQGFLRSFVGMPTTLVVLPEYFLTSFPLGESIEAWQAKACIEIGGPEYEKLGEVAQKHGIYLSGNAYELDPHFTNLYFQTSFIIDPCGDVVLRYRRLVSMFAPTPHDVLDQYLDAYGEDSLFPVAETDIGRLACVASEEILYPELTRAHALRGAEIICHSSSEVGSPQDTPKNIAKRARAYENGVYVVSANSAGINQIPFPAQSTNHHSQVVNYLGAILGEAGSGESMCGNGEVDLNALRRSRRKAGMTNCLARQRLELFSRVYTGDPVYPANSLAGVETVERSHFQGTLQHTIHDLAERGII